MPLKLYNTLTRSIEDFNPLNLGEVTMYNCGPTVYDYAHIGNLRGYVNSDVLRRLLEHHGYKVKQVINITDVGHLVSDNDAGEDKIEKGARREKKTVNEIIAHYTEAFLDDLETLNINPNKIYKFPRATEHIEEQITLISTLEDRGYTYVIFDGVYFDTAKYPDYAKLAGLDVKGLKEGVRVKSNPEKRNPTDFALWKFSKPGESREQEWESPWGLGFPGWHIECSAMAMKYLGETLDIHTGGVDHIPVHHTNEIAQSVCATGVPFARFWIHHEFVNVKEGKMSKSEGNFIRLATLRKNNFDPLSYRYLLLQTHYRSPVTFSFESLEASGRAFAKLTDIYINLGEKGGADPVVSYSEDFFAALDNDLNTAEALAVLWKLVKDGNISLSEKKATVDLFDSVLGMGLASRADNLRDIPEQIIKLAEERDWQKKNKNYTRADELREEILEKGYVIEDKSDGFSIKKL